MIETKRVTTTDRPYLDVLLQVFLPDEVCPEGNGFLHQATAGQRGQGVVSGGRQQVE